MNQTTSSVLDLVLEVFSNVASWFRDNISIVTEMFYDGELTFMGILAVAGLAISVGGCGFSLIL